MVTKWIANGVTLQRNPDKVRVSPKKTPVYQRTTEGQIVRIMPPLAAAIETDIEVGWILLEPKWKNWLWTLYTQDTTFTIKTNLEGTTYDDATDTTAPITQISNDIDSNWQVKIDTWNEDWRISGENQRFDLVLGLRKV